MEQNSVISKKNNTTKASQTPQGPKDEARPSGHDHIEGPDFRTISPSICGRSRSAHPVGSFSPAGPSMATHPGRAGAAQAEADTTVFFLLLSSELSGAPILRSGLSKKLQHGALKTTLSQASRTLGSFPISGPSYPHGSIPRCLPG